MKRQISSKIDTFLKRKQPHTNVLIVQGARQVGKTYLVEDTLSQQSHVIAMNLEKEPALNLEIEQSKNFSDFTKLLEVRKGFKSNSHQTVFIDEAQENSRLGAYVRDMKETWSFTKTILTGSSMNRLFREDQRVPVGRMDFLTVHPFSFREFLRSGEREHLLEAALDAPLKIHPTLHQELLRSYDSFLRIGGLPEAVLAFQNPERDFRSVIAHLVASQREDFLRKEKAKPHLFIEALRGVANHVGSTAKFTHISDNKHDATKIMTHLVDWFIVHEVEVLGTQATQRTSTKRYLYDTGVLRFVRNAPVPELSVLGTLNEALRVPLGGIAENAVLLAILAKENHVLPVSTWRKSAKEPLEVDFVVQEQSMYVPIEVKASLKITPRQCHNLVAYARTHDVPKGRLYSFAEPQKFGFLTPHFQVECLPIYLAGE